MLRFVRWRYWIVVTAICTRLARWNLSNLDIPRPTFCCRGRYRVSTLCGLFLLTVLVAATCLFADTSLAIAQAEPEFDPDTILLGVRTDTTEEELRALLSNHGLHLDQFWPQFDLASAKGVSQLVTGSALSTLNAVGAALEADDLIRYTAPDQRIYAAARTDALMLTSQLPARTEPPLVVPTPNDPRFGEQYAFDLLDVIKSWNVTEGTDGIVIGVIDSGYDSNHNDIPPDRIWSNPAELNGQPGVDDDNNGYVDDIHGWDWVEDDNVMNDPYGHGTHVTGVIVAAPNNETGVSGMAPNVRVASLRVLDQRGGGFISDLVSALAYAESFDFPIVNLSLVILSDSDAIHDAVKDAHAAGLVIVAATGNVSSLVQWPAAYAETVAVAATDSNDNRATFSGQGDAVDVAAPGVAILSTYRDNTYVQLSGTSMATPQVSALLGLILSLRPDLPADDLIDIVKSTAQDVNVGSAPGNDSAIGAGRVDFYSALLATSETLSIAPASPPQSFVAAGADADYPIRVTASGAVPVIGAKVFITSTIGAADSQVQIPLQTDSHGLVTVSIEAPPIPGQYAFDVQVGAKIAKLPVTTFIEPVTVTLTVFETVVQAGDEEIPFQITLQDQSGTLKEGSIPVSLNATLGIFVGNSQSLDVIVTDGSYAGTFSAGPTTGDGELTARVASISDSTSIRVLPGAPAQIVGEDQFLPLVSDASTRQYRITYYVTDLFGNAVLDNTLIRVKAPEGKLSPTELETVGGVAITNLTLSTTTSNVAVTASVPGTNIQETVVISIPQKLLWLPIIGNTQPAQSK